MRDSVHFTHRPEDRYDEFVFELVYDHHDRDPGDSVTPPDPEHVDLYDAKLVEVTSYYETDWSKPDKSETVVTRRVSRGEIGDQELRVIEVWFMLNYEHDAVLKDDVNDHCLRDAQERLCARVPDRTGE